MLISEMTIQQYSYPNIKLILRVIILLYMSPISFSSVAVKEKRLLYKLFRKYFSIYRLRKE